MKPRDIMLTRIQQFLCAPLAELGFKFTRSKMVFWRIAGIAKQQVEFQLDRYNSEDECTFWTNWRTRWPGYSEWHERHFNQPESDFLGYFAEWNIPGWSRKFADRACLHNDAADDSVMQRLLNDFLVVGIPFLESISTLEGAAEQILASPNTTFLSFTLVIY